jgi:hypothetical protein
VADAFEKLDRTLKQVARALDAFEQQPTPQWLGQMPLWQQYQDRAGQQQTPRYNVAELMARGEIGLRQQQHEEQQINARMAQEAKQAATSQAQLVARLNALGEAGLRQQQREEEMLARAREEGAQAAERLRVAEQTQQLQGVARLRALGEVGLRQQAAEERAQHLRTPAGRAEQRLQEIRDTGREARRDAAHLQTPQGQAELQETARLRLQIQGHAQMRQEMAARAESIAQHGRLGDMLIRARQGFAELAPAMQTAQRIWGGMVSLGRSASPNAGATLDQSWELLKARAGRFFLPAMANASQTLQAGADAVGATRGSSFERSTLFKALSYSPPAFFGEWLLTGERPDRRQAREGAMQSFAGLPQSRISSAEEYYDRLQMTALNTGPLEAEILKEQLENLKDVVKLLEKIGGDSEGLKNLQPAYR